MTTPTDTLGILFDRSRVEAWEKCPRLRFWQYEYKGRGVYRGDVIQWPLVLGDGIHEAVEQITFSSVDVNEEAIAKAYNKCFAEAITVIEHTEDDDRRRLLKADLSENYELLVAIVHAWKYSIPEFLANYSPLESEREELLTMDVNGQAITLMTRTDMLSKRLVDGATIIHNLKSVSNPDKKWQEQWPKDQQTLTEPMATEHRLGSKVDGVVVVGLCKGRRNEYPKGSGNWFNDSPLTHCWHKRAEPPLEDEYYAKYEWTCPAPHTMKNGRKCEGGRPHRLSGVYKAKVSEVYPGGIPAWVDYLSKEEPDVLRQQVLSIPAILRNEWEFERWKRMVVPREVEIHEHGKQVMQAVGDEQLVLLDYYFPMHTGHGNCTRPYPCEMIDVCWGSDNPEENTERYKPRVPNHEAELVRIQGVQQ